MRIINLYQETLGIVSDCCKVSKEKIISSKKEECVNARYILVSILGEWYTDNEIAELTGLSRPCTNKIRNKFKSRLKRYNVNCQYQEAKEKRLRCSEMAISSELDTNYSFSNKLHR